MKKPSLLAFALIAMSVQAEAATSVQSFDAGWYMSDGFHTPSNTYTSTNVSNDLSEFRSFYAFNVAGLQEATGISITFYGGNGVFYTDTGTETIGLFDYAGSITPLVDGTGGVASFADLGTGSMLGQHTIRGANNSQMPQFTVNLAPAFVGQFNAARTSADPRLALGAALQTASTGVEDEAFWSASGMVPAAYLTITSAGAVPEPATWAMMILGFGMIGGAMRRRQGFSPATA